MNERPRNDQSSRPRAPNPGVRRNLFQGQLTRRPQPTAPASPEPVRLDVGVLEDTSSSSSEIVVRDQHGDIELGDPPTPILEDLDDEIPADERQETEKERQKLAEAVKHHQVNQATVPDQPEELLDAVRASLRAKVNALADDNWMFEKEEPLHK